MDLSASLDGIYAGVGSMVLWYLFTHQLVLSTYDFQTLTSGIGKMQGVSLLRKSSQSSEECRQIDDDMISWHPHISHPGEQQ